MALPAAVTLASAVLVVASGVGYAVSAAASGSGSPQADTPAHPHHAVVHHPTSNPPATSHKQSPPKAHKLVVPSTLVVVFNNTAIRGLAAQKATFLRDAGWHVAAIDNWYGDIPASTVYYPPHLEAQAKQLAKVLHITRVHPAVAPMQFDRLTVILASG